MGDARTHSDPEAPRLDQSSRHEFLSLRGKDAKFEYVSLSCTVCKADIRIAGLEMVTVAGVPQRRLSAFSGYRRTTMLSSRCMWLAIPVCICV